MEKELDCYMDLHGDVGHPCRDMEEELNCNIEMLAHPCRDMEEELDCNMVMLVATPAGTWRRSLTATW